MKIYATTVPVAGAVLASSMERGSDRGRLLWQLHREGERDRSIMERIRRTGEAGTAPEGSGTEEHRPQRGSGWPLLRPGFRWEAGTFVPLRRVLGPLRGSWA